MALTRGRVPVVVGVDVGSTNTKAVAMRADGLVVARASSPTPRGRDDPSLDATVVLRLVEDLVLRVLGEDHELHAVASAGVGEDGVLVDAGLDPTTPALAWFDPRRRRVFRELHGGLRHGDRTGVAPDPSRTVVGWAWSRRVAASARSRSWLALTDYPASAWTGAAFMSDTVAARTAAWDVLGAEWIADHVDAALGDAALLPRVVRTGDVVGELRQGRLRTAGVVADGAVVVAGGHDHPVAGWAVDLLEPGSVLDSMGTAEVVVAQARARVARTASMDVSAGIRQSGTTLLCVAELGRNVEWASLDPEVADAIVRIASGAEEPDEYLDAAVFVPGVRGGGRPFYTLEAPAHPHSRASAVLGALARTGGDAIREVRSSLPSAPTVYAAGGWSRAPGWLRIKERLGDATRLVPEAEVTAVGAALLAATALGWATPAAVALGVAPPD